MSSLTVISVSNCFFFLSLFFLYVLCQQPLILSIYCSISPFFSHSVYVSFYGIIFPPTLSPPLSGHLVSLPVFHVNTPCQPNPHHFLHSTFLHSNLFSQFIHSSLISSLNSSILLTRLFSKTWTFSCFFFFYSCHRLKCIHVCRGNTRAEHISFKLILDMRLSPVTLLTFLQAFAPNAILIITKANYLVDLAPGNLHFL